MCHPTDSLPPTAPDAGDVADHGPIQLTAEDGNVFAGYQATPASPNGSSVVLLPDARGAHPYYEALAQRFAEAGYQTVVIDYYGRTAGLTSRDDSFDFVEHWQRTSPDDVAQDAAAAVQRLDAGRSGPVFSVGFCWGGGHSWRLSATGLPLAGSIGFYGLPGLVSDVVDDLTAPLLLLLAGDDVATSSDEFTELTDRLTAAGKPHEVKVYDGAPHSFFDRTAEEWQDASTDAWHRLIDFTRRHTRTPQHGH